MRFKRLLAAGLAGMMAIGALAGCGGSSDGKDQQASSNGGSDAQADSGELVDLDRKSVV